MSPFYNRRTMLAGLATASLAPAAARLPSRPLRVILLGQSLIQQELCARPWPGMDMVRRELKGADVVFTDLETAIDGPGAGPPTREGPVLHAAKPEVIDCLRFLGVTIVTTANNHAWDLGPGGILAAARSLDRRGIPHAGTGRDLAEASAPAFQVTRNGVFGLVSAAAGAIRDGAAATPDRPGVNELRLGKDGLPDERDVARVITSIRTARQRGATVLMCLHNHHWEPVQSDTPGWQKAFARACVDAGAAAFVGHGTPLMQGYELYRGAPLFHGLGNFMFQTRKPDGAYGPETWRSLLVEARFADGTFIGATLKPLLLDSSRSGGFTRGVPRLSAERPMTLQPRAR